PAVRDQSGAGAGAGAGALGSGLGAPLPDPAAPAVDPGAGRDGRRPAGRADRRAPADAERGGRARMTNVEMAAIFRRIGDLLEIKGDNPFKIQAYRRAAETLEALDVPAAELVASGAKVPGFGEAITGKIEEMERTGRLRYYEELSRSLPITLLQVMRIPGLGRKTVKQLWEQLGVASVDDLETAARQHRVAALKGLGPGRETRILQGIEELRNRSDRASLGSALRLAR